MDFGSVFGDQNDENSIKMVFKNMFFFNIDFQASFFRILTILARFWEAPGLQKIAKNRKKSCSGRVWNAFGISKRFWKRFWSNFSRFWMDFEIFWEDFGG